MRKTFVEIRVQVLDANGSPADLRRVKAEITTRPPQGEPHAQAMQLMLPHGPGPESLSGESAKMPDGRSVRVQLVAPAGPFETPPGPSAYFKADREWPAGADELPATLKLSSPEGESKVELRLKK